MFERQSWIILGLAAAAALAGGLWQHHRQAPTAVPDGTAAGLAIGQPAPALVLPDLNGQPHALADYRGRPLLITLWATGCAPCQEAMPALQRAHDAGAQVLGIALDDPRRVTAFLDRQPVSYPILIGRRDGADTALPLGNPRRVLPYSVLLDAQGRVQASHAGPLSAALLRQWLGDAAGGSG